MADSLGLIPFTAIITALVRLISQGDYEAIAANGQAGRMGAEGIKRAVETYPYTVIPLPSEAFEPAEVYRIDETLASTSTSPSGRMRRAGAISPYAFPATPSAPTHRWR